MGTIHRLGQENRYSTLRHRGSASTDTRASGLAGLHHYKSIGFQLTRASSSSTATSPTPCSRPPSSLQIMPEASIVEEDAVQTLQLSSNSAAFHAAQTSTIGARPERQVPPSPNETPGLVVPDSEDSRRTM